MNLLIRVILPVCLGTLPVAGLGAQTQQTIPLEAHGFEGQSQDDKPLGYSNMRYQQAVGAKHLPFAKDATLLGLHFRREGHDLGASQKSSLQWTVRLTELSISALKMDRNFEKNLDPKNTVTVFQGKLVLAAYTVGTGTSLGGPTGKPSVQIPFTKSYKYRGGTLLVDILAKDPANKVVYVAHQVDRIELAPTAKGWLTHSGHACPLPHNRQFGDDSAIHPGGQLAFNLDRTGKITNYALSWLGLSMSQWGPIKLPLELTPLWAPGCYIRTDLALVQGTPVINEKCSTVWGLPNDSAFVGIVVNSQWAVNYTKTNRLGLTFTDVMQARITAKGAAALDAAYHYTIQEGDITKPWLSLKVAWNKAHVMVFTVQ